MQPTQEEFSVKVSNLPSDILEEDIADLFK